MFRLQRLVPALLGTAAALVLPASSAAAADTNWQVTIHNLTPPGSQALSPPLLAVHNKKVHLWQRGQIASHAAAAIIEDANNAPAVAAYTGFPGVREVFTGLGGPIASGSSRSYRVRTSGARNRLSILTMLVNTNDAFTGVDSLRLSGGQKVVRAMAYDGGSERNNQLRTHVPGPCCGNFFVRDPEGAPIAPHAGIQAGVGDLDPAVHGWTGFVARITVSRLG
jgi:hypothetical protein